MVRHVGLHEHGDAYLCNLCLGRFEMPSDARISFRTLTAAGMAAIRVVLAYGSEVHRCAHRPRRQPF